MVILPLHTTTQKAHLVSLLFRTELGRYTEDLDQMRLEGELSTLVHQQVSAGATNVNVTFSGGGGTVWQGNNIIVQPLGGGGSIGSLSFYQYRSVVTQADYNSLQSSSAPSNIKNATFYITD